MILKNIMKLRKIKNELYFHTQNIIHSYIKYDD